MKNENDILKEINDLSSQSDFLKVLMFLVNENLNCSFDQLGKRNYRELLNENEITFLFGLWLKNRHKKLTDKTDFKIKAQRVHELMNDYHLSFLKYFPKPKEFEDYLFSFRKSPPSIRETVFYGPSGAYDYQFIKYLDYKYSRDKEWLLDKKDFSLEDAKKLYVSIKSIINYNLNTKDYEDNIIKHFTFNFNSYIFKKNPYFIKILDTLSIMEDEIINQAFNKIGDLNHFKIRPVIKTNDSYIIPLPYTLSEALYDSPFYWMIDDKKYINKAQKNRGDIAEEIVGKILSSKINSKYIHSEVEVKKVKGKTITDIDICVVQDKKMLIFQVKSKRLSQLSKNGDISTFEKDFEKAVTNAHRQAVLPYDLILNNKCYFQYKGSNKKLELNKVNEIYSACIVLDSYPAITAHTRLFFDKEKVTPIAMSIFDLEIVMKYSKDFDAVFNYFKKRTQNSKYFIADSELSFFGGYLETGLLRDPAANFVVFDSAYGQKFDSTYYPPLMASYEKGFHKTITDIGRNDFCFCGSGVKFKKCCGATK